MLAGVLVLRAHEVLPESQAVSFAAQRAMMPCSVMPEAAIIFISILS